MDELDALNVTLERLLHDKHDWRKSGETADF